MHTDTMGCYLISATHVVYDSEDNFNALQSVLFVVSPLPFLLSTTIVAFTSTMVVNIVITATCQLVPLSIPLVDTALFHFQRPPSLPFLPHRVCQSHICPALPPLLSYLVPMNLNTQLQRCHVIGAVIVFQAQIYNGHCVIHGGNDAATTGHVYH